MSRAAWVWHTSAPPGRAFRARYAPVAFSDTQHVHVVSPLALLFPVAAFFRPCPVWSWAPAFFRNNERRRGWWDRPVVSRNVPSKLLPLAARW